MRLLAAIILVTVLGGYAFGQSNRSSSSSSNSSNSSDRVLCTADARWSNTNGSLTFSKQTPLPVSVSLLTNVSKGTECANAEIQVTATFLSETQTFICSGTITNAMTASTGTQNFNLEIRPFSQSDFLRWRNQPGVRGLQQGKPLICLNIDATSDVGDSDRIKATWIRINVAVLPTGGGLSVLDALIQVNP